MAARIPGRYVVGVQSRHVRHHKDFTALINPPQSTILAVGVGEERAEVVRNGKIEAATIMSVTLSCDQKKKISCSRWCTRCRAHQRVQETDRKSCVDGGVENYDAWAPPQASAPLL